MPSAESESSESPKSTDLKCSKDAENLPLEKVKSIVNAASTVSQATLNRLRMDLALLLQGPVRYSNTIYTINSAIRIYKQWRLLPYLAAGYAMKALADFMSEKYIQLAISSTVKDDSEEMRGLGIELHGILSSAKSLCSWIAQKGIQECREACGGHGYLKSAGFGNLRNDNDANCTYEGDNNVLLQQTSNWLLQQWEAVLSNHSLYSPLKSISFLKNYKEIQKKKFHWKKIDQLLTPEVILEMYQWLICHLLNSTKRANDQFLSKSASHRHNTSFSRGENDDTFMARNETQAYLARTLSLAFAEYFMICCFLKRCREQQDSLISAVLLRLCTLFALWRLESHLASFYEGGYADGPDMVQLAREGVVTLCSNLKKEAVALVDAISPPDFILNSSIGHSSGEVYKYLQSIFFQTPGALDRPSWWQKILPSKAKL